MIREVTMYETSDGRTFRHRGDACTHEAVIVECDAVLVRLGLTNANTPAVQNALRSGNRYMQLPSGTRTRLQVELQRLGASRDSDGPIGSLLSLCMCIDRDDRLWEQPYFVNNPNPKATAL